MKQHVNNHATAKVRGGVQRRSSVVGGGVDVGVCLQQLCCHCVLAFPRSQVERGTTVYVFSLEFSLRLKITPTLQQDKQLYRRFEDDNTNWEKNSDNILPFCPGRPAHLHGRHTQTDRNTHTDTDTAAIYVEAVLDWACRRRLASLVCLPRSARCAGVSPNWSTAAGSAFA